MPCVGGNLDTTVNIHVSSGADSPTQQFVSWLWAFGGWLFGILSLFCWAAQWMNLGAPSDSGESERSLEGGEESETLSSNLGPAGTSAALLGSMAALKLAGHIVELVIAFKKA